MSIRISGLLLGAALALTVTAAPAAEDVESANYIMPGCRAILELKSYDNLHVQGMCAGIVNTIAIMGRYMELSLQRFPLPVDDYRRQWMCIETPIGSTLGQEVRIVVAYIDSHPARMHEDFKFLALEALRAAWPCK